jgi:hypothetical protein
MHANKSSIRREMTKPNWFQSGLIGKSMVVFSLGVTVHTVIVFRVSVTKWFPVDNTGQA